MFVMRSTSKRNIAFYPTYKQKKMLNLSQFGLIEPVIGIRKGIGIVKNPQLKVSLLSECQNF